MRPVDRLRARPRSPAAAAEKSEGTPLTRGASTAGPPPGPRNTDPVRRRALLPAANDDLQAPPCSSVLGSTKLNQAVRLAWVVLNLPDPSLLLGVFFYRSVGRPPDEMKATLDEPT